MEKGILDSIGYALSCMVELWIVSDFMNRRFYRKCRKTWVHRGVYLLLGVGVYCVNLFQQPIANFLVWIGVAVLIAALLYDCENQGKMQVMISVLLITVLNAISETISFFCLLGLHKLAGQEMLSGTLPSFFYTITALIMTIAIYRLVFSWMLQRKRIAHIQIKEYLLYFIVMIYSVIHILVLIPFRAGDQIEACDMTGLANGILLLLLNLYISDLIGYLSENNALKMKIALLGQRSVMQEEHFHALDQHYETALRVLHDVKKHIRVIGELYRQGDRERALAYTQDISGMLSPLMPVRYTSDHILNTILNDKVTLGGESGVVFSISVEDTTLTFMDPIDVTALFGNLLDNALEACRKCGGERKVRLSVRERNQMLFLCLENSREEALTWDRSGLPLSGKGEGHGIGLMNIRRIVEKYHGDMLLEAPEGRFVCRISLNMRPEREAKRETADAVYRQKIIGN